MNLRAERSRADSAEAEPHTVSRWRSRIFARAWLPRTTTSLPRLPVADGRWWRPGAVSSATRLC
eukprot:6245036-Prymnesium_polylepis.1